MVWVYIFEGWYTYGVDSGSRVVGLGPFVNASGDSVGHGGLGLKHS